MAVLRNFRVLLCFVLLVASPLLQVANCQSDHVSEDGTEATEGSTDLGYVDEDPQDFVDVNLSPAPGVETVCVFPKNSARLVTAGEESELIVGMKNDGDAEITVLGIRAKVYLPFDHSYLVQNLSAQGFNNATVPASAQASFPYIFAVSKYLQAGTFDLEGVIIYEIDQQPYQSTFYNGSFEVVEAGGFITMETVLLVTFGIGLVALFGLWVQSQFQNLSKKSKKAPKVEVGTGTRDASMDEWLQGTSYTQSSSIKAKKKNK